MTDTEHLILLTDLISRLSAADSADTIASLAEELSVPPARIRNAIGALAKHPVTSQMLLHNEPDFLKELARGLWDKEQLSSGETMIPEDFTVLPLQPADYRLLSAQSPGSMHIELRFEVKNSVLLPDAAIRRYCSQLGEHIDGSWKASFLYGIPGKQKQRIECIPCRLLPDASGTCLYLLAWDNQLYDLHRIHGRITFTKTGNEVPDDPRKYLWSCEDLSEEPVFVKIRITNVTKNRMAEIRKDLQTRSRTAKLYPKGEFYYYEDSIIGLDAFTQWVRSYGSAMTVVRPKALADRISEDAQRKADRYALLQKETDKKLQNSGSSL